jgi:hypothetical protein
MLSKQEEIERDNTASLNTQRETRARRAEEKSFKEGEKSELALQRKYGVNSTKARREIKAKWAKLAEEAINRVTDRETPKPPPNFYKAEINNPLPESEQQPATTFENNNPDEIIIPDEAETPTSGGAATGGGGDIPDGFEEQTLSVCYDGSVVNRIFLVKEV